MNSNHFHELKCVIDPVEHKSEQRLSIQMSLTPEEFYALLFALDQAPKGHADQKLDQIKSYIFDAKERANLGC